ncbi:uncharacterized protein HMPREF1541_00644 [Cyphellophora europaea CBS 101466]|uniref:Methyltransferase domain-containing protein n=1 Tax=Cyphellophora europaea (strain CBS 101466) TaxID=1220924 RepID=W2SEZ6_CYPE1|nr:uncharacterized protein HMPREF1541_00644 [Cyphellophora europaea CBS 101466]ETN46459.1 hypothetical protein HMPREF1541_00644 [Cyphellophora europaea CBS 101466]
MADGDARPQVDPVQVDPEGNTDAVDSSLGDDGFSHYSESLRSSVMQHRFENGRRYHTRDSKWYVPNDEDEQDRMDVVHHLWKLLLGGELVKYKDRVDDWSRVLDVGTGTGIWAIEMADEHPEATVIGTDLSPIQPSWVPPNCHFYVEDAAQEWTFESPFSLIHTRMMSGSFPDWPLYYQRCFQNTKPGGVIEAHEYEFQIYNQGGEQPPAVGEFITSMIEASTKLGSNVDIGHKHREWIQAAGYENVEEVLFHVPLGTWAKEERLKEIGRYNMVQMVEGIGSYAAGALTAGLGRSIEDVNRLIAECKKELLDKSFRHYVQFRVVYGKKAKDGTE